MAQLISNLPVGSKVKFGKYSVNGEPAEPITWLIVAKNHTCTPAYPTNSVTLLTEKVIDVRAYDAAEPNNTLTSDIKYHGYDYYSVSNIDQWLNKSDVNWYSPAHEFDQAPNNANTENRNNGYDTRPGFLNAFTSQEINAILNSTISFRKWESTTTVREDIVRKVFLPSSAELGYSTTNPDGACWEYFKTNSKPSTLTSQAFTYVTDKPSSANTIVGYWTRTSQLSGNRGSMNIALENDDVVSIYVYRNAGVRPALNLSATIFASDTTDSEGCYSIITNEPPTISGVDENLGVKSEGFTGTYTITDTENDVVTVTESIDGVQIRSLVATLGQEITYGVTETTWLALANGSHTLTISATDGINTTVRNYTFTKLVDNFTIENTTPLSASEMPGRIMLVITKNVPSDAIFKVEVCNNGYDTSPTWEDATDAIVSGVAYSFRNDTKTATNWGVKFRVTVERNGATGACYISAIGGNFE